MSEMTSEIENDVDVQELVKLLLLQQIGSDGR
jgi:hypothetical protein